MITSHDVTKLGVDELLDWESELAGFIQTWDQPSTRWMRNVDTKGLVIDAAWRQLRLVREEIGARVNQYWAVNI
jgi:hypothetical protein